MHTAPAWSRNSGSGCPALTQSSTCSCRRQHRFPISTIRDAGRRNNIRQALAPEAQIGEYLPLHLPALPTGSGGGTLARPAK